MEKMIYVQILLMCVSWCYGQKVEDCVGPNFADLESSLLANRANRHQISMAYFPLRHEVTPVCVTSYYYIGINSSTVDKPSCLNLNLSDGEEVHTGCSKWQWCINSFYMALDVAQLQDLSFYIILDTTTEVELELPPLCNNIDENIFNRHFLRITTSLYQYARNKGQLGNGTEFVGYAAKFRSNSDLVKLTYESKLDSVDKLLGDNNYSIDLYKLHTIVMLLNLFSLPMFTTFLILFTHLDYIKNKIIPNQGNPSPGNPPSGNPPSGNLPPGNPPLPNQENLSPPDNKNNSSLRTLKFYLMFSFVVTCCLGVAAMMYFQISAFKGKIHNQYFYLAPYICLWVIAIGSLVTATIMIMHNGCTWKSMLKCTVLGMGTMTMQLLSWHLVFVFYGLILNPLRAFLYSVAIIIAVLWAIFTLALLSRITIYVICQIIIHVLCLIIGCVMFFGCTNVCCQCGEIIHKITSAISRCICGIICCNCGAICCNCGRVIMDKIKNAISLCVGCCGYIIVALINKIKDSVCENIDEIKGISLMGCLITLLTFTGGFSVFILHISITSEHPTLDELSKSIIPKVFLIIIIWLLYNIFLNSNRTGELWLLPRLYTDMKQIWNYVDFDRQETKTRS